MTKLTFNLITIRVVAPTRSTTSSPGMRHVRALGATISQKTNERINHSPRVPALPSPELLAPLCRSTKPTGRPSRSHACLWKANSQPGGRTGKPQLPAQHISPADALPRLRKPQQLRPRLCVGSSAQSGPAMGWTPTGGKEPGFEPPGRCLSPGCFAWLAEKSLWRLSSFPAQLGPDYFTVYI